MSGDLFGASQAGRPSWTGLGGARSEIWGWGWRRPSGPRAHGPDGKKTPAPGAGVYGFQARVGRMPFSPWWQICHKFRLQTRVGRRNSGVGPDFAPKHCVPCGSPGRQVFRAGSAGRRPSRLPREAKRAAGEPAALTTSRTCVVERETGEAITCQDNSATRRRQRAAGYAGQKPSGGWG